MEYLIIKWLHVLSSAILFGTGIGSAWYMLKAGLQRDAGVAFFVSRQVVMADWIFTATTVVIQPVTGFYLVHLAGFAVTARWIAWSLALYCIAGACWLPVVWIQIRMRELARVAAADKRELPPQFTKLLHAWIALGIPAFLSLAVVFYLMIAKPQ